MKRMIVYFALLSIVALAMLAPAMLGQNQQYPFPGYPPEMAPSRTSRPRPPVPPRVPPNRFNRAVRPVPGEYIVVLNDDTPSANVASIISTLANAHGGVIKYSWTKLRAFSVRMPEAEAIALSNDPRVLYVEENGLGTLLDEPWDLVRINQQAPVGTVTNGLTNGTYAFPNDGSGVHAYVIDTGIRISHHQFLNPDGTSRASVAYDSVDDDSNPNTPTNTDGNGRDGLDCNHHGTLVASIIGGKPPAAFGEKSYGVAQNVSLYSVRAAMNPTPTPSPSPAPTPVRPCAAGGEVKSDEVAAGIYWVANNAVKPAVANLSVGCYKDSICNTAADFLSEAGVTVVAAAPNNNVDVYQDPRTTTPATAKSVITVGGSNAGVNRDVKYSFSDFGSRIDVFAPAVNIPAAEICIQHDPITGECSQFSDSANEIPNGNSTAAPQVTGVVAMYLHNHPSGTDSLPWIVRQVIKSNANICTWETIQNNTCVKIANRGSSDTPDRLLYSNFLATPANPIYNQRFFIWQHYADFLARDPDEAGLDFWTRQITQTCSGASAFNNIAGVNLNSDCTVGGSTSWPVGKRIDVSRAFWVDKYKPPFTTTPWFTDTWGLAPNLVAGESSNLTFIKECYKVYLKRTVTNDPNDPNYDSGVQFWLNAMNYYGHPNGDNNPSDQGGVNMIIDSFLVAWEYELRFGPHS